MSKLNPNAPSFIPLSQREPEPMAEEFTEKPFIIVLIGPPGCGKSTQGRAISKHFGFEFFCVSDAIRESMRRHERDVKSASILDDKLKWVKKTKGIVIEWVTKPDHLVIVEETCRRHGVQIDCTLMFDADDIAQLVARVQHSRPADTIMPRILDFMFVEQAFQPPDPDPTFCRIDAMQPCTQVTLDVITAIDKLRGHMSVGESSMNESDLTVSQPLMMPNLTPAPYPCLQFVCSKSETLQVLTRMHHCVGLQSGSNMRKFPGTRATTLEDAGLRAVCNNLSKFYVSKKVEGARLLGLYMQPNNNKGDNNNNKASGWYLIDGNLLVFRVQGQPLPAPSTSWPDMLVDGSLVAVGNSFFFLIFDTLHFNGSVLGETLDSRLEHLYNMFPPENVLLEQQQKVPSSLGISFMYQNYYAVADLPRLVQEFDFPHTQLYPTDGLLFTCRNTAYKCGLDKNVLQWKPISKTPVEFRLIMVSGGFQLSCIKQLGRETREAVFDSLEATIQLPSFGLDVLSENVGKIVECVALQPTQPRQWQVINPRHDKGAPMREDVIRGILNSAMSGHRLLELYYTFTHTTPDTFQPPPMPHGTPSPVASPTTTTKHNNNSSSNHNNHHPPLHPHLLHHPIHQQQQGAGGGGSGGFGSFCSTPPPHPHQLHLIQQMGLHHPHHPPLHPHQLAAFSHSMMLSQQPPVPLAQWKDDAAGGGGPRPQNRRMRGAAAGGGRTEDDKENANLNTLNSLPRSTSKKLANGTERACTPTSKGARHSASSSSSWSRSPERERRSPQRFSSSCEMDYYPSTPKSKIQHSYRRSPERRSPARSPIMYRSPERVRGNETPFSPSAWSDGYYHGGSGGGVGVGGGGVSCMEAFITSVREWLTRKFTPPPSMAKPRPYTVLDLCLPCDRKNEGIARWDKYKAATAYCVCSNQDALKDAEAYLAANETEMKHKLLVADCMDENFKLENENQQFEVIACFKHVNQAFKDEETCQRFFRFVSSHLKPGGALLVTMVDADVLLKNMEKDFGLLSYGNSQFTISMEDSSSGGDDSKSVLDSINGNLSECFGHSFKFAEHLDSKEREEHQEYIVTAETFTNYATKEGLKPLDYGTLNFHEVATYLKKHHLHSWHMVQEVPEQCDMVGVYCTGVYKKIEEE